MKEQQKKKKKANKRTERKVSDVADVLDNFTLDMDTDGHENYDFKVDFA